jgi:hypothetical protein
VVVHVLDVGPFYLQGKYALALVGAFALMATRWAGAPKLSVGFAGIFVSQ